jgi:tetratricopeptide (TPR) repeat protein/biotin operon repressor
MAVSEKEKDYIRKFKKKKSPRQIARELGLKRTEVQKVIEELKEPGKQTKKQEQSSLPPLPPVDEASLLKRNDYYWAALTAVLAFVVLLLTTAPDLTGEDSGELITAAYTLGVAHPPGYPLWCILGKIFTIIIPVGTIAFRINFMSVFFAAAAIFFLFLVIKKQTKNRMIAASVSLLFGFSFEFWSQSNIAEVYTLNCFFIAACLFLLQRWEEKRSNRILYLLALMCGLGCTNHHTMAPLSILFALYIFFKSRRQSPLSFKVTGIACLIFVLALSVYLYLPIRSQANPYMNWGQPDTIKKSIQHVLRSQYKIPSDAGYVGPEFQRSWKRSGKQMMVYASAFIKQFTWGLFWLPILGLGIHFRRKSFEFYLLLSIFLLTSIGFILFSNFMPDAEGINANDFLFIPSYMVAAIWMGTAVHWLWELGKKKISWKPLPVLAVVIALLLPVPNLLGNFHSNDKSNYYYSIDFGHALIHTLAANAIIFPEGDHKIFPLLYLQGVLGMRPDVTIANKYGQIEKHLYPGLIDRVKKNGGNVERIPRAEIEKHIILKNPNRPIYFTIHRNMSDLPGYELIPEGLLYRAIRKSDLPGYQKKVSAEYWEKYKFRNFTGPGISKEYTARLIFLEYHIMRAQSYFEENKTKEAFRHLDKVKEQAGHRYKILNNTGNLLARRGFFKKALEFFERALSIAPDNLAAINNIAKIYFLLKDYNNCNKYLDRVLDIDPNNPEANDLKKHIPKN